MRYKLMIALALAMLGASACKDKSGVTGPKPIPPAALVRFVNAVVDTGIVDFRFIDRVENLPTFQGVRFRGSSGVYQRVTPGNRAVRIFPYTNDVTLASARLIDTTITLAANERYTLVYWGQARGNADRLLVIQDVATLPTPPAGNTAVRALHADPAITTSVDVYVGKSNTDPVANTVAKLSNVAPRTLSPYVNVPVARAGQSDSLYTFAVTPAGSTTATYTSTPNVPGSNPTVPTTGPQPGVQISGSVLTAVLTGTATPGSPAASSANVATSARVVLLPDKPLNP